MAFCRDIPSNEENPDPEDKEPKSGEFSKNPDTLENPDGRKTVKRIFFLINFKDILNFCQKYQKFTAEFLSSKGSFNKKQMSFKIDAY